MKNASNFIVGGLVEKNVGKAETAAAAVHKPAGRPETIKIRHDWREGKDAATVVLTVANHTNLIAPTKLPDDDGHFMMTWGNLEEADRQKLLTYKRLDRRVIDVACRLAGTTFDEAQRGILRDSPEARAEARQRMGLKW